VLLKEGGERTFVNPNIYNACLKLSLFLTLADEVTGSAARFR
jgi:hypothetical protein